MNSNAKKLAEYFKAERRKQQKFALLTGVVLLLLLSLYLINIPVDTSELVAKVEKFQIQHGESGSYVVLHLTTKEGDRIISVLPRKAILKAGDNVLLQVKTKVFGQKSYRFIKVIQN